MVDEIVIESMKVSVGEFIIFFNNMGFRFEGKILAVDDKWLKYFDTHKHKIRFIKLSEITDVELG